VESRATLPGATIGEMEALWQQAKAQEGAGHPAVADVRGPR
jgi:hypothetical protein